jgi:murein DD-endopeptidase MepM/ murein hydrolase activator NlpD
VKHVLLTVLLLLFACEQAPDETRQPPAETSPVADAHHPEWTILTRQQIRSGDTLEGLMLALGIERELLAGLVREFDQVHDHRRIRPGQNVGLLEHRDTGQLAFACWINDWKRVRVNLPRRTEQSQLAVEEAVWAHALDSLDVALAWRVINGRIDGSLYEGMLDAGGDPAAVLAFTDIFQWDIDFFIEPRSGDRFRLVMEEKHYTGRWLDSTIVEEGRILAASYITASDTLRACWFEGCDTRGYFDEAGSSFQKTFLKSPLNYRRISSRFGSRRHPVTRKISNHPGVDFAAPSGTPIVAPAAGTITTAGTEPFYGRVLRIRHNERFTTVYGHLSGIAKGLKLGSRVEQNQVIGYVGATGRATGPHLHYEFHDRGRIVDPLGIQNDPAEPLPADCREAYADRWQRFWPQ